MATHTTTGGDYGRKFAIGRENKLPDGRPYLFEWIQSIPSNIGNRKFETRVGGDGKERHYELFGALDGYLIGIDREAKMFNGTANPEAWIVIHLIDAQEEYTVEIGRIDSRWSTDFMKRILDANFNPNLKIRISPVSSDGKIYLSTYSGADKLEAKHTAPHLAEMPQPITREWKGKTEYDWTPVAEWLYEQVKTKVCPRLMKDPISAPIERKPLPAPTTTNTPQAAYNTPHTPAQNFPAIADAPPVDENTDDLPF